MKRAKMIFAGLAALAMVLTSTADAGYFDAAELRKAEAHATAEAARSRGAAEDDETIRAAQAEWWKAETAIQEELDMLGRVVYFEAGSSWLSDRHQQLVACVLLNRCADARFPATIKENVYKKGQYSCASRLYNKSRDSMPKRCFDNARAAAYGEVSCPAGVIYQAQFKQGSGVYEKIGNTYFCWG